MSELASTTGRTTVAARRRKRRGSVGAVARHLVLIAFSALALFPIYFMVVNALKTNDDFASNATGPPHHVVWSTFRGAVTGSDMGKWLLNSLFITVASVAISTALAALAAYPLSLMRWRPGRLVTSVLIAIYTGIMLPFCTFLLASFFSTMPRPLLEAARMDGATTWRTFTKLFLP